jgi:hypothetical protein
MGVIPRFTQTVLPSGADLGAISRAQQPFQAIGQAVEVAQQMKQAKDTTFVNKQSSVLERDVDNFYEQNKIDFQGDPDAGVGALQNFMQSRFSELSQDASPEAQSQFAQIKQNIEGQYLSRWGNYAREQNVRNFAADFDETAQNIANVARNAGKRGESLDEHLASLDANLLAGSTFLGETDLKKLDKASRERVTVEYLEGVGESNPNQLKQIVEDYDLPSDTIQRLDGYADRQIAKREAEFQRAQAKARQETLNGIDLRIFETGDINNEQSITFDDLEAMVNDGQISVPQYISRATELEKSLDKREKEQDNINLMDSVNRGDLVFNPNNKEHKNAMDDYYEKIFLQAEPDINAKADFAVSRSAIPSKLKSEIQGSLYSGTNDAKVEASNFVNSIINRNPSLARQFNDQDVALSSKISTAVNAGLNASEAVEFAQAQTVLKNDPIYKARNSVFAKESADFKKGKLNQFFRNDPNTAPPEMASEWKTLYRNYVVTHGVDDAEAQELAYSKIKSTWGVSRLSGDPEWVKYAPEIMYNVPDASDDWLENHLKEFTGKETLENVNVIADIRTVASGEPAYQVVNQVVKDGNLFVDTLKDENGSPVYWKPDYTETKEYKDQAKKFQEQKAKTLKEAERQRKRNQEIIQKFGDLIPEKKIIKGPRGEMAVRSIREGM